MTDRQNIGKKTVIVVDDEPIIRMDLGQMLEELNYEVIAEGADGFDAVELCRKKNPDVVLLDLEMAYAQGKRLAKQKLALGEANKRLEENRVIERAKGLLAKSKNISEMDAYRKMQKTAMEKRAPLVAVARAIIRVETQRDEANQAKKWLMREQRMTEQEAYRYIVKGAEKSGLTVSAFAKKLMEEEM